MRRIWLGMVAVLLMIGAGMSAQAALRAIARHGAVASNLADVATLPGDTALPVVSDKQETAAPAAGVTGTIDLPDLPIPAGTAIDVGIVPARPFSTTGISAIDRGRAVQCLTAAIYYEAASEPDAGQQAVAQVILNRTRHPAFPATVCGVVYQGSEHAGCQFSFACDGAMARIPNRAAWMRAARTAGMALSGYVYAPVGLATHYHTYAVTPAWNRGMVMTDVVGAHFFHRWKGYWGTSAAFSQHYGGGEPVPGPHTPLAPIAPPTPAMIAAGIAAADTVPTPSVAAVSMASVQRGAMSMKSTTPTPAPVADDMLPPESQILERWKDSGKPLK
ncbi:cell wall hydrolase [Sphingomonas sp. PP-CE-3A-406]|uniref:cell wall hydrolase n=1 Tax=Sphingomonas sp. PP-CE-3A-406 TaxID=2135659 RepID=UPI000EF911F7|nr:cell wall hydrolase [Sphingomonas sp. PP-CE-3A-406]RMB55765.1 cell wall hydrolase [Sphingomonas sp. PP-CE-3A-406]